MLWTELITVSYVLDYVLCGNLLNDSWTSASAIFLFQVEIILTSEIICSRNPCNKAIILLIKLQSHGVTEDQILDLHKYVERNNSLFNVKDRTI